MTSTSTKLFFHSVLQSQKISLFNILISSQISHKCKALKCGHGMVKLLDNGILMAEIYYYERKQVSNINQNKKSGQYHFNSRSVTTYFSLTLKIKYQRVFNEKYMKVTNSCPKLHI